MKSATIAGQYFAGNSLKISQKTQYKQEEGQPLKKWLILMVAAMVLPLVAFSQSAAAYPQFQGKMVNDFAGVIPSNIADRIEARLRTHRDKTTNEVVVAVARTLDGQDIKQYSEGLFQSWGIGKKGKDNGVLILIATDEPGKNGGKGRRRIEVGYGLEGQLTDGISGEILRANRQAFDDGRIGESIEGLVAGVLKVITPVEATPPPTLSPEEKQRRQEARQAEYQAKLAAQEAHEKEVALVKTGFGIFLSVVFIAVVLGFGGYFAYHLGGEYLQKRRERKEMREQISELVTQTKEELDRLRNLPDMTIGKFDKDPEWVQAGAKRLAEELRRQIAAAESSFLGVIEGDWRKPETLDKNLHQMRHAYAVIGAAKETVDDIVGWPAEVAELKESAAKALAGAREEMAGLKAAIESVKGQGFRIGSFDDGELVRADLALTQFDEELKSGLDPRAVQRNIEKLDDTIRLYAEAVLDLPRQMQTNTENAKRQHEMLKALGADRPAVEVIYLALCKSNPISALADLDHADNRDERFKAVAELLAEAEQDNTLDKQDFAIAKTKIEAAGRELSKLKSGFAQIREREREIREAKSGFQKMLGRAAEKIRTAWSSVQSPDVMDAVYRDRLKGAEGNIAKAKAMAGSTGFIDWLAIVGLILAAETSAADVHKEAEATIASAVAKRRRIAEERAAAERRRQEELEEEDRRRRRRQEEDDERRRSSYSSHHDSDSGSSSPSISLGGGSSGGGGADD